MESMFKDLFDYTHKANQLVITAMLEHRDALPDKAFGLLNHILNAHQIWNSRIQPVQQPFGVWARRELDWESQIDRNNYAFSISLLASIDLESSVVYTNSKGQTFENRVADILFHIVNHSTYHRGQIATLFRESGLQPVVTDYIMLKRGN
ncbi:MAG: damage-inducible protein DinB [Lunatimonas sp.]|nr:damage-inducible protein DinB [Lunatimonas sp.]